MIFSSIHYVVFFIVVLLLVGLLRRAKYQKALLIVASYIFYAWWDPRFLLLLFILSMAGYVVGLRIEAITDSKKRKWWLAGGVAFCLALLGVFKYYNFFISSLDVVLNKVHVDFPLLNIVLPVGISFMVFEVISYLIDIYRRESRPAESCADLLLLVAFFPHLIAGPILKPKHFLPQLRNDIVIRWKNIEQGISIFVLGLLKKVLIANNVASFADAVFASPQHYSTSTIWLGVLAYAIQIYADFSGYSDMAIGSARCLGFDIPRNFNFPYVSANITEFWRRWHISLSTWLREYLYISLGGNRNGKTRQYVNLMIVMLLGGLWHGASWNFVVWGGMHGIALALHKFYAMLTNRHADKVPALINPLSKAASIALTLVFVLVTWVFFRATNFHTSSYMVSKMFGFTESTGIVWNNTQLLVVLPLFVASHILGNRRQDYVRLNLSTTRGLFLFFFALLMLLALAPLKTSPFIYFQF